VNLSHTVVVDVQKNKQTKSMMVAHKIVVEIGKSDLNEELCKIQT
jgi:hypothetical protein